MATVNKKEELGSSTFDKNESIYRNHVRGNEIGAIKLCDFNRLTVERYYNKLENEGKTTTTIKLINILLKSFFKYAVEVGHLARNPCSQIDFPTEKKEEKKIFTEEEREK